MTRIPARSSGCVSRTKVCPHSRSNASRTTSRQPGPRVPYPEQLHLDFIVDDLDEGERHILEQGATKHSFQPGADQPGDTFRVYLDPVGHPFCLVLPY